MVRATPDDASRKHHILDAARACFVDRGFAATRMDEVAERAGLSKGGLYFHFPSKDALIEGVVARENEQLFGVIGELIAGQGPVRARIRRALGGLLSYARLHVDAARLSQCVGTEAARGGPLARLVADGDAALLSAIGQLAETAHRRGELSPGAEPAAVARLVLIVLEGAKNKLVHHPDWPWAEIGRELEGLILRGLFGGPEEATNP